MFGGESVTAQEKWVMTIKYMQAVRANYAVLSRNSRQVKMGGRMRHQKLARWLEAAEAVYRDLRSKEGKSSARARHDWLVARTLEIMVFKGEMNLNMRRDLTGPRALNRQYVDALAEAAILAVEAKAEEMGLLG